MPGKMTRRVVFLCRAGHPAGTPARLSCRSLLVSALMAATVAFMIAGPAVARPLRYVSIEGPAANAATARIIRSAQRGNARSQTYLGFMYAIGQGVPQDLHLAAKWYRRGAEQGDVRAQHLLGLLYDKGQGVSEDYIEAHKWSNLAASRARGRDREYFARIRDAIASKMSFAQFDEAQRRARWWRPRRER